MRIVARLAAYFAASATSSAVFTVWMACRDSRDPAGKGLNLIEVGSETLQVWPYVFALALLLMFLPWCLITGMSRWLPFGGPVYSASGSALAAILAWGCLGGLFPARGHPSFTEGFALALEANGLPVLISGAIGGLIYWLVRERAEHLKNTMRSVEHIEADAKVH